MVRLEPRTERQPPDTGNGESCDQVCRRERQANTRAAICHAVGHRDDSRHAGFPRSARVGDDDQFVGAIIEDERAVQSGQKLRTGSPGPSPGKQEEHRPGGHRRVNEDQRTVNDTRAVWNARRRPCLKR